VSFFSTHKVSYLISADKGVNNTEEKNKMKNLLRSKAALSTVVTTLIILVVSVLLATVVTFYAINVTTTRVQEESLQITRIHTWHDGASDAETAFYVVNTGGRDVVLEKIAIRGIAADMATQVYFNKTATAITGDLSFIAVANILTGHPTGTVTLSAVTGTNLVLASGESMIVYVTNPGQVSVNDIGVTIGVTVFTANAQYYKESNVEAAA
jgi:hypothetical protein